MKRIIHTLWIFLAVLAVTTACSDESVVKDGGGTTLPDGDVHLRVNANIPAPRQVVTRDVDPDGLSINSLWLFCFDQYGGYIGRREATDLSATNKPGHFSFTVDVPGSTRRIHFLSNVYLDDLNATPGTNETTLIPSLVTASGRMAYWGRTAFASADELAQFAINGEVELFRSQAQVRWKVTGEAASQKLQVWGYAVCNRRAWGTVAPFNPEAGAGQEFAYDLASPYVTDPGEDYRVLASDPEQVTTQGDPEEGDPHYIFENPNTLDAPVYAVMRIGTSLQSSKYYKVMFVDDQKEQLPIYRNYEYVIHIHNVPSTLGYESFEKAKEGIAANNAWVSVDPEIPELSDGTNTLNILDGTTQIFNEGGAQYIDFTYTGNAGDVHVEWLENDGSLSSDTLGLSREDQTYHIRMNLAQPGDNPAIGTLLLRAGVFTRQIKIYLMKPFEFKPVWVSTGVPMNKGERLSMTFVIPDNYPAELFPITCKIATNKMNANNDLGVQLPIISEECVYEITDENGETKTKTTNWGYKFVYTATRPGIQEVFFKLNVSEGNDPSGTVEGCEYAKEGINHTHVFVEADNFKDEEKVVLFQGGNVDRYITVKGAAENNPGFLLTPLAPTVNQPVAVTLHFSPRPDDNTVMRMATTSFKPDFENYPNERDYYIKETPDKNDIVDYYWIRPGRVSDLTLHFLTMTPDVSDLVRFSIDGENSYNQDDATWYKSAAVELRANPGRFDFGFTIVDDTPNIDNVRYGLDQPADMHLTIPDAAVEHTDLKLFIRTGNLKPDPKDQNAQWLEETDGGYYLNIPQGTHMDERGTLKFLTKRIASAETVTISTVDETQALFNPASATFANEPISGTLKLGDDGAELTTESFITLERKNGTRVGVFGVRKVNGGVATYDLTLRSEYDFTMDEPLTVYYSVSDGSNTVYQAVTTFNELATYAPGLITLQRQ